MGRERLEGVWKMRHRHSGPKVSYRTTKGRVMFRERPIHSHKMFIKKYQPIVNIAKKKGYKVFDLDRRQSTVDEVDIPETYKTDGMIVPDEEGNQRRDLIFIDDDAKEDFKKRAFAHELGHQHLFASGEDDGSEDSNLPKIEHKADKIGADILGMTVKEFNSPDVTYKDVISNERKGFFSDREEDEMSDEEYIAKQAIEESGKKAAEMDTEDVKIITRGVKEDYDAGIDKIKSSRWQAFAEDEDE